MRWSRCSARIANRYSSDLVKNAERKRLTVLMRDAVARLSSVPPKVRVRAEKAAAKYSPTNGEQYRDLAELTWLLIAAGCDDDAMGVLDALCEVDDKYYWMYDHIPLTFGTRAWLRTKIGDVDGSRDDARKVLEWLHRPKNAKPLTEADARDALKRFDIWLDRARNEKGAVTATHVLAHALRVLGAYEQCAAAGDPGAKSVESIDYSARMTTGVEELRRRIQTL